jgi:signal transduction histidine kinase
MTKATNDSTPPVPSHQSEAITRGILEAVPGGIVQVQADGAILNANAEALRVLGLSYDALTQRYTSHFEPETIWEEGSPCPGAIVTFLDITERKAVEAERAALEEQLHHAQRLDSIGQLAGGIAHDFNNLLQIILGNTEPADDLPSTVAQLNDIRGAAERAAELTEGLLAFARRRAARTRQRNARRAGAWHPAPAETAARSRCED